MLECITSEILEISGIEEKLEREKLYKSKNYIINEHHIIKAIQKDSNFSQIFQNYEEFREEDDIDEEKEKKRRKTEKEYDFYIIAEQVYKRMYIKEKEIKIDIPNNIDYKSLVLLDSSLEKLRIFQKEKDKPVLNEHQLKILNFINDHDIITTLYDNLDHVFFMLKQCQNTMNHNELMLNFHCLNKFFKRDLFMDIINAFDFELFYSFDYSFFSDEDLNLLLDLAFPIFQSINSSVLMAAFKNLFMYLLDKDKPMKNRIYELIYFITKTNNVLDDGLYKLMLDIYFQKECNKTKGL